MQDHQDICLCFHVTAAKIKKFIRIKKPVRESQLSECYGAGTGCGWCRPYLKSIFDSETSESGFDDLANLTSDQYSAMRQAYRREKSGPNQPNG